MAFAPCGEQAVSEPVKPEERRRKHDNAAEQHAQHRHCGIERAARAEQCTAEAGQAAAERGVYLIEHRQDLCQQHDNDDEHEHEQHERIRQCAAHAVFRALTALVVGRERIQCILELAGLLAHRDQAGNVSRIAAGVCQRLRERRTVVHRLSESVQHGLAALTRLLLGQKRQPVRHACSGVQQQRQLPAESRNIRIALLLLLFFHGGSPSHGKK